MNYYIDIKLLPDEDVPMYFIRNKIYTKLHKALFTMQANDIGVSFPKYRVKLGDVIRLHGSEGRLAELQAMNWLGGLSGYCDVSDLLAIPLDVKYRIVSRKQHTMSLAKLEKRVKYQKTNGVLKTDSDIQAYQQQYKAKMEATTLDKPYLELESSSNGHKHRRYIQFGELTEQAIKGEFDQFGLSKTATIPWF